MDVGLVKMSNFKNSENKAEYGYILTAEGIKNKIEITKEFIKKKEEEYSRLEKEITHLRQDLEKEL